MAEPSGVRDFVGLDEDSAALHLAAQSDAALCTVVGIEGSFSRRIGAQFAVATDGRTAGSLSDGCLESELCTRAAAAKAGGAPVLLRFGRGSPIIDFRLPCGSGLDVLIDPFPDAVRLAEARQMLVARKPALVPLPLRGDRTLLTQRLYLPPLRVIVLGSGPEHNALFDLAKAFGVDCVSRTPGTGLSLGRHPDALHADAWSAVVCLFHDHEWERALLDWALGTSAFYIGALGGAFTRIRRTEMLREQGHSDAQLGRIRGPIGLIPHTREARVLALSILSEIVGDYERLKPADDGACPSS